jgi:ribosome-binding protein aMBF1 (putative translation factor)
MTMDCCEMCGATAEDGASLNLEAFEVGGKFVCDDCADEIFAVVYEVPS